LQHAALFAEAGIPSCIDKPVVGSVGDVQKLIELDRRHPGKIFGGSSCQFAEEIVKLKKDLGDAGAIVSATAVGCNDLFSYGIHNVEMLQAVVGYDAEAAQCRREGPLGDYFVRFGRGFEAHLLMHNPAHGWFLAVNTMKKGVLSTGIDAKKLYKAFLERFVAFTKGELSEWSLVDSLQPILVAIAMDQARKGPGQWVRLDELSPEAGFNGAVFAEAYRDARDRGGSLYQEQTKVRWKQGCGFRVQGLATRPFIDRSGTQ
jgi:predicted dehydrogenase